MIDRGLTKVAFAGLARFGENIWEMLLKIDPVEEIGRALWSVQ